ncbi:MAG TPA: methylenetetrahydrofolate--tRNA-(uracil(54)-C(5))-methyltransferase (FADH(2)-oxidizing) TrmFO [Candidatus Acidoferrum sp.]|nr:methylenetetrahydrofolate--tRNA-(uracil(54)-C(5))-methyltransferase (FADH(2)-oxidizing) TrmFO [Candidatus Acidoferrum sp.]
MIGTKVEVIGAGLAGCEAVWQLVKRGVPVLLRDIKPDAYTPAHSCPGFAELVCSNSLRAASVDNAVGLLKEEMRHLDSLVMRAADLRRIPAGGALAVDREGFSRHITETLQSHPLVTFESGEVSALPEGEAIIATGPLTTESLSDAILAQFGQSHLHFFDAAAPIVTFESIDMGKAFFQSRYGKGSDDYINCPMSKEEYLAFREALSHAEEAPLRGFEDGAVFEGCVPIEVMARRGEDTMRYGPLKPVGLKDPKTGEEPYAVVQLRQDDAAKTLYNLVGFQTHLKFPEQRRVFGMIPGLEGASFARYGVMHRNTYIASPLILTASFQCKSRPNLFFAGQMTGVEGYVESAASGLVAGVGMARHVLGLPPVIFPVETAIGALGNYVSTANPAKFQPMNINFGIISPPDFKFKGKKNKNPLLAQRSLSLIDGFRGTL